MRKKLQTVLQLAVMLVVMFHFSSCKKDDSSTTPTVTPLAIGGTYQGGKIFYLLQSGDVGYSATVQHGLIAAPNDTILKWSVAAPIFTGASDTTLGAGNANTNTIISILTTGSYAAKYCSDLVLCGYSDWYLPSKAEMFKLFRSKAQFTNLTGNGYWTSSETDATNAYMQGVVDGHQGVANKMNPYSVRPIRSF